MPRPTRMLLLGLSLVSASFLGWSLAASLTTQSSALGNQTNDDLQAEELLDRLGAQGELAPNTRRKLLERLLARGRFEDALLVLQPWLAEQPRSLNLALLSADLQRLTGNIDGAVSELKQLLGLHPLDAQVLQLLLLVEQTNGNGEQALNDLQKRFNGQQPGTRLELGLLLADALRLKGQPQVAEQLYGQLANESPADIRPPLALALMKRDEGEVEAVQALLQEARHRRGVTLLDIQQLGHKPPLLRVCDLDQLNQDRLNLGGLLPPEDAALYLLHEHSS